MVLSTAYLAYLAPSGDSVPWPKGGGTYQANAYERRRMLAELTHRMVTRRASWLRASVVALGLGLVFLPLPFIAMPRPPATATTVAWPAPPTGGSEELAKVLYTAQVAEAAQARAAAAAPAAADDGALTWGALIAGLLVVAAVPPLSRRRVAPAHGTGAPAKGPDTPAQGPDAAPSLPVPDRRP